MLLHLEKHRAGSQRRQLHFTYSINVIEPHIRRLYHALSPRHQGSPGWFGHTLSQTGIVPTSLTSLSCSLKTAFTASPLSKNLSRVRLLWVNWMSASCCDDRICCNVTPSLSTDVAIASEDCLLALRCIKSCYSLSWSRKVILVS